MADIPLTPQQLVQRSGRLAPGTDLRSKIRNPESETQNLKSPPPSYLAPYHAAAQRHGGRFASLLWASRHTQAVRFQAIQRGFDMTGRSILDAGCGRADLLNFLLDRGVEPADYVGLEAITELADAARRKRLPNCTILTADFVADPLRLFVGADVVVFSGSLNTLSPPAVRRTIQLAFQAAVQAIVFNFLASPELAGHNYLTWHRPAEMLRFGRSLSPQVRLLDDYLPGDATMVIRKIA